MKKGQKLNSKGFVRNIVFERVRTKKDMIMRYQESSMSLSKGDQGIVAKIIYWFPCVSGTESYSYLKNNWWGPHGFGHIWGPI